MTPDTRVLPAPASEFPEISTLLATGTRHETPCGSGSVVWHAWQPATPVAGLRPLVLLHGGSGSWTHWVRNIEALTASGREVFVPDLPGFGDSALSPLGKDAPALPVPLAEGLQVLLGHRVCDLVGFSFGGMVAGFLAEQFAERVARLVLVGAPGLGVNPKLPLQLTSWRHLADPAERVNAHRNNLAELMLSRPEAIDDLALGLHMANVERDRMPGRRLARTDILWRALAQVRCPVNAIYGHDDRVFHGQFDALETALQHAPQFRKLDVIAGAGHWVQYEQPAAFNRALLAVLDTPL